MKPKPLKRGDWVALVTPATPISPEKIDPIVHLLENEGYQVRTMPHALDRDGYLAGTDQNRAKDLQDAFDDPAIGAVICTRGGYGCARLLPHLDLDRIARSGKLFAGFSDVTTLHLALNRRGVPTLHSPMALTLAYPREPWVIESFLNSLKGDLSTPAAAPRAVCVKPGLAEGTSVGGCLCLVTDSIGTPHAIEADGKILFLEDVDEAPHRIDAMLTHLRNTEILFRIAGLVVGEMTRTDEKIDHDIGSRDWRSILRERVEDLQIPIVMDYPFGHAKNMLTVGLGVQVELNADAGTVSYLENFCG
jgi:muramoyltetrapeptide carboxypeptidase